MKDIVVAYQNRDTIFEVWSTTRQALYTHADILSRYRIAAWQNASMTAKLCRRGARVWSVNISMCALSAKSLKVELRCLGRSTLAVGCEMVLPRFYQPSDLIEYFEPLLFARVGIP
jgi:hypothetical protein